MPTTLLGQNGKQYQTLRAIGEGSYAKVYFCEQIGVQQAPLLVAKLNMKDDGFYETQILALLQEHKIQGIPPIVDFGHLSVNNTKAFSVDEGSQFIIQPYLGPSLIQIQKREAIQKTDAMKVGIKLLKILEKLHEVEYMHCDIKPDNFLIDSDNQIQLIDFGLAQRVIKDKIQGVNNFYRNAINKIQKQSNDGKTLHEGNVFFNSINQYKGLDYSPRDDIFQLAYSIIYMTNKFQPTFQSFCESRSHFTFKDYQEYFLTFKLSSSADEFCRKNETEFMIPFLQEAMQLGPQDSINYGKFRFLLEKEIMNEEIGTSSPMTYYSWQIAPNNIQQVEYEDMILESEEIHHQNAFEGKEPKQNFNNFQECSTLKLQRTFANDIQNQQKSVIVKNLYL